MSSHEVTTERKFEVAGSTAPKKIAKIQFGTLPTDEIQRCAELQGICIYMYMYIMHIFVYIYMYVYIYSYVNI
jgi:hypothetical protein